MVLLKYELIWEIINFVCVVCIILGLCIDILLDIFKKEILFLVLLYNVKMFIVNILKYKKCLISL